MRLIYVFLVVALLAVVGTGIVMAIFPKFRPGPVQDAVRQARGYGPADTPEDALEKFRKAIKERDYETAATFVGGDFAEQMTKSAEAGEKLGTSIDALNDNMESNSIKSDTAKLALWKLQPFPKEMQSKDLVKKGDVATAILYEEVPAMEKAKSDTWSVDPMMFRSMQPDLTAPLVVKVEIRKEGKGYKIFFPPGFVSERMRRSTERLRDNHGNYVRGVDQVKYSVKNEASTRENIEADLKRVLEAEAK